ncbi:hypothetical protein F5I97DRAFT_1932271 [Phlebopus sp. FC_14]|nr:hypothetical protein F5I97DRAFT_1932271 [Phlebopus sp. FC_14]
MKMLLFRPTFLRATTVTSLAVAVVLSGSVITASAAPQFGRPLLHVLDEASSGADAIVDGMTTLTTAIAMPSSPPDTGLSSVLPTPVPTMIECDPGDPDPNPDAGGSVDVTTTNPLTNGSARTRSKSVVGGGGVALALGFVASALVFVV